MSDNLKRVQKDRQKQTISLLLRTFGFRKFFVLMRASAVTDDPLRPISFQGYIFGYRSDLDRASMKTTHTLLAFKRSDGSGVPIRSVQDFEKWKPLLMKVEDIPVLVKEQVQEVLDNWR